MSYSAVVTKIYVKEHPNADKLQIGLCKGVQVIVGLDVKDGDIGVLFEADGQLSDEFCQLNDLYPRFDEDGKRINSGFIDSKNRRVRAQNFRGEKSEGFWCPLSYFNHYDVSQLVEGFEFTEINGKPICNKYETEATKRAKSGGMKTKKENAMFPEHFDTKQFVREIADVNLAKYSKVIISEKLHGTSFRYAHVLDNRKLSWFEKLLLKLKVNIQTKEWQYLMGTRRVILEHSTGEGYYGDESFRYKACERLYDNLQKGEIIYGEIVGYVSGNRPIMNSVNTKSLKDKEFTKRYGETMTFSYGCEPDQQKIYVYRIVHINEDGHIVELTWEQVKARCNKLGVDYVPELTQYRVAHLLDKRDLTDSVNRHVEGESTLDNRHIREGVCVRFESGEDVVILKHKSFNFKVLEGIIKDSEAVDIEEAA